MNKIIKLLIISFIFTGCAVKTSGTVKKDTSLTDENKQLVVAGENYTGPQYTIGILAFENKTPSKVLGIGEAATDILRTMLKEAGLEPIMLTNDELKQHEKMMALQMTGIVKTGTKDASSGMDSIDFRVSGSISSYSEAEESSDMLLVQSKTQIARVGVDYALVDIASGKTLVAKSGMGEYKKKTGGAFGFGSSSTADTGLRASALRDALSKTLKDIILELSKRPFQSKIILVEDQTVLFRGGTRSKLSTGTKLGVYRAGQDLIDPDTGRILGKRKKKLGEINLTSHQNDKISEANTSSGSGFKRGDIVKVIRN